MSAPRTYGWRPPPHGHLGARTRAGAGELAWLPEELSLEHVAPDVTDQGSLGSCTGQASACALAMRLRWQRIGNWLPAALDLYLGGRRLEGTADLDAGALLADVLKHAEREGFAPDALWPYVERVGEFRGPPPGALADVRDRTRLVSWEPLDWHLETLQWELWCGYPVVLGAQVFEAFERVEGDGVVAMPAGRVLGGHAMCAIGYSNARRAFRVQNSWGATWGNRGRCWIPYDYVLNPFFTGELHAVRAVRAAQ